MTEMLRVIRKEKKMTQMELAEASGVHRTLIARYETGRTTPSAKKLLQLSSALGCKVDDLIGSYTKPTHTGKTA